MKDRIWITGGQGLLGRELSHFFSEKSCLVRATGRDLDITQFGALERFARDFAPTIVMNAAGQTNVDRAEDHPEETFRVNKEGTRNLAELAGRLGARFVHFSTDYVFSGESQTPYTEQDVPDPLGIYGRSKWEGEREVPKVCEKFWIFRVSWLYGSHKSNFLTFVLNKLAAGEEVRVAEDQRSLPTWTLDIAQALDRLMADARELSGLFHLTGQGSPSRWEWIAAAASTAKNLNLIPTGVVGKARQADFPAKARRPVFSVLDSGEMGRTFDFRLPPWQESVEEFLIQLKRQERFASI